MKKLSRILLTAAFLVSLGVILGACSDDDGDSGLGHRGEIPEALLGSWERNNTGGVMTYTLTLSKPNKYSLVTKNNDQVIQTLYSTFVYRQGVNGGYATITFTDHLEECQIQTLSSTTLKLHSPSTDVNSLKATYTRVVE